MRCRISAAALRVNVIHRISSGFSTLPKSFNSLWVISPVLPDPAGADTIKLWFGSSACKRALASFNSTGCVPTLFISLPLP